MTVSHRISILLAVLTVILFTPAWAQQAEPLRKGWGIAAGLGTAHVEDVDGSETFSGDDFGFSFEFEYRFNEHFALAASSINLGEATDTFNGVETRLSVRGAGLVGRFILPVSSNVDIYGRLGSIVYFADLEPGGINGLFGDKAYLT